MSNNKKETEQKVMTKYDQKMQKRQEEKAQAAKADKRGKWIGIIGALIVVCVLLSFPITSYVAANSTYFTIGDEKVTRVEFDYAYQKELANFLASDTASEYMFYGYDFTGDLSKEYINDYVIGIEILQGISGTMGVIMTVPLVSVISAFLMTKKNQQFWNEKRNIVFSFFYLINLKILFCLYKLYTAWIDKRSDFNK